MPNSLTLFEAIVRRSQAKTGDSSEEKTASLHPFDERNIHPSISAVAKKLFDDGHYSQATFEVYKFLDTEVSGISNVTNLSGEKLMMEAFKDDGSNIRLTNLTSMSEKDEQRGYRFLFAGTVPAIRNPRGHIVNLPDTIDICLDHLSIGSALLRRLEARIGP
jgi:uncharacterized protein (TIGR02391 family)